MSVALVRRQLLSISKLLLLLFLVTITVFVLQELIPGDTVDALVPPGATDEQIAAATERYGLNDPVWQRYGAWLANVVQGDFGRSFQTSMPVSTMITERAPVSLEVAVLSMLVALAVSIPIGVWSAYRPGGLVDRCATLVISAMLATPNFVLGVLLAFAFAVQLRVLPVFGWVPFGEDPVEHFRYLVLPVVTLAAAEFVLFARLLKGDMMATLQQAHVLSARVRGLPTWRILVRHALRQSSFSLITVSGVVIGRLIGGTVVVEMIFGLPGLGQLVVNSIMSRDYVVVQAVVLLSALLYLALNTLVDLTYPLLDPRVRKAPAA